MKRKLLLMSFAMMAGLPHAVFAKSSGKESARPLASWDEAYMPHYGNEGAARPLMEHLEAAAYNNRDTEANKWQMNFSVPRADLMGGEDPAQGRGGRAGISLKLDF